MKLHVQKSGAAYFMCPGCKAAHQVNIAPNGNGPVWGYNGDADRPTISPSVLTWWTDDDRKTQERCHSFVTDGRIQFLADCTHELAGQTVDLPDWTPDPIYEESAS